MRIPTFYVFFFLPFFAFGQDSSPLQQYMGTHSLVARPEVFRSLQDNLETALGTPVKGAQLEALYSVLSRFRVNLSSATSFHAVHKENVVVVVFESDSMTVEFQKFPEFLEGLEARLQEELKRLVSNAMSGLKPDLRSALTSAAVAVIKKTPYTTGLTVGEPSSTDGFVSLLVQVIRRQIEEYVKLRFPGRNLRELSDTMKAALVEAINSTSRTAQGIIADAFDVAEKDLRDAISEVDRLLVSANSGLAVTEGRGEFAGGIQLTWWMNKTLQFGIYVSRQQSSGDTVLRAKTLIGFRGLYAFRQIEVSLLAAHSERESIQFSSAIEVGVGLALRLSDDAIARAEFYSLKDGLGKNFFIGGVSLQATKSGSPVLFVGYATQAKKLIYQLSFPILTQGV